MTIRVLLADDDALLRAGLAVVLSTDSDLDVVAEAADGLQAVDQCRRHAPDVVLMDVRMPGIDGIEATRRIVAILPDTKVLILTTFEYDEYVWGALRAGASGFLLKRASPERLLDAIHTVATGEALLDPAVTRTLIQRHLETESGSSDVHALDADARRRLDDLTARERQVLALIGQGRSNAEIAELLVIADSTAKTHVKRILAKIDARDRAQAVVFAYRSGLIRITVDLESHDHYSASSPRTNSTARGPPGTIDKRERSDSGHPLRGGAGNRVCCFPGTAAVEPFRGWPWATTVAVLIVGLPTLAQFTVAPSLLQNLERNWILISHGQVWRLLTSLVVQDGGVAGAIFNLVALATIGFAAEKLWGGKRWTAIALSGALGAELWGKIVQPIGAGNSVAVFSLAASIAIIAVLRGAGVQRLLGLISLVGAAVLLIICDIHGAAATIGAVLGGVLATRRVRDQAEHESGS